MSVGKPTRAEAQLSDGDRELLGVLVASERWAAGVDLSTCDPSERAQHGRALHAASANASHLGLLVRARNLRAILRADFRQDFGPSAGLSSRDPAFVVPLAHAAKERREIRGEVF